MTIGELVSTAKQNAYLHGKNLTLLVRERVRKREERRSLAQLVCCVPRPYHQFICEYSTAIYLKSCSAFLINCQLDSKAELEVGSWFMNLTDASGDECKKSTQALSLSLTHTLSLAQLMTLCHGILHNDRWIYGATQTIAPSLGAEFPLDCKSSGN